MDNQFPVVIIGSGLAGLTAGVHLAERGIAPLVLEASSAHPGGRLCGGDADTFEHGGRVWSFTPDHGVHALWGGYDNMRAVLDKFIGVRLQPSGGEEWINRWGRDVRIIEAGSVVRGRGLPAPFHYLTLLFRLRFWQTITPLDFLSLPGFLASLLWTVGLDPIKEGVALDGLTMKEYFRGWTPNLKATFTGLGANLLAAPVDDVPVTAFIAALRFYTMLRRDAWQMQYLPGNSHDTVIQPLVDKIEEMGGMVLLGATAQSLTRSGDGWRVVFNDQHGGRRSLIAENVILAVDAPAAKRLLDASPDTASSLRFPSAVRSLAIRMWFSRQPREGAASGMFTGDFEIDNFFWLHRLYDEFKEWRASGGSALETHMYGPEARLDLPDKNLLIMAINEVQRAFPELKGSFVYGIVRRNSRTQTLFRVPTKDSLHVETPFEHVYACGDWIGYPSPAFWMERATVTGIAAANQVLQNYDLEPFKILDPKPPEFLAAALGGVVRGGRVVFRPVMAGLRRVRGRQS